MSLETTKIKRLYQVPKQDKHAFSLQYKKDTSKDPSIFPKKGLLRRAGRGAKLGLLGMGSLQYQAPIPSHPNGTSTKGLLKKKKK